MKPFLYRATPLGLTIYFDEGPQMIDKSHPNFANLIKALAEDNKVEVDRLLNRGLFSTEQGYDVSPQSSTPRKLLEQSGFFVINQAGDVFYPEASDDPIHGAILARIIDTLRLGLDIRPLLNFLERLANNPSYRSREQLFDFLDRCDHPILADGRFLAYKSVKSNRYDAHTGSTFLNVDNAIISMPRSQVDDDPTRTCSRGLHVCSRGYGRFSDIMLEVAVCPSHVVSVPTDYDGAKMRVCEYQVLQEVSDYSSWGGKPVYDADYGADYGTDDGDRYEDEENEEGDDETPNLDNYFSKKCSRDLASITDELAEVLEDFASRLRGLED